MEVFEMNVPINILSGFLGSGKTTLLRQLLMQPGQERTAVVVNEYASSPIDHLLLAEVPGEVRLTPGGCVCCAPAGELASCVASLLDQVDDGRIGAVDRVIIETSGLADPSAVLASLLQHAALIGRLRFDGFLITADTLNGAEQLQRFPEAAAQIAVADRLLLSKTDLTENAALRSFAAQLTELNPGARQIRVEHGQVQPYALFGAGLSASQPDQALAFQPLRSREWLLGNSASHRRQDHRHSSGVSVYTLHPGKDTDWQSLHRWLSTLTQWHAGNLLRIKGVVKLSDVAQPLAIHAVHHVLYPPVELTTTDAELAGIVFIVQNLPREYLLSIAEHSGVTLL
jgi:G3E family GTPase